jgi:hypothetical protein
MPLFGNEWVDLESIIQASEAERRFDIGERDRLRIAANLSMAVEELHLLSVYCIDLKPENIRINLRTCVAGIIDCDGMSVVDIAEPNSKRFHADKSTPEFWAPENLGIKPHEFKDEEAHDRFALATVIFMLLNRGIHPYQGVIAFEIPGTETTAGKIKNDLYPHGTGKGKISPLPASLYPYWPAETRRLFDLAFSRTNVRPSAEDWRVHLYKLLADAETCSASKHHVKFGGGECPICSRDAVMPKSRPSLTKIAYTGSAPRISAASLRSVLGPGLGSAASAQGQATSFSPPRLRPIGAMPGGPGTPSLAYSTFSSGQPPRTSFAATGVVVAMLLGMLGLGVAAWSFSSGPILRNPSQPERPSIDRCADTTVFYQAGRGGASGLKNYLAECRSSGGPFVQQATNALESAAYEEASSCIAATCAVDSCIGSYLQESQASEHLQPLRGRAENRKHSPQCDPSAPERDAWANATSVGSAEGYSSYLAQFPNGAHAQDARQRLSALDDRAWTQVMNNQTAMEPVNAYLAAFPNGRHADGARERSRDLQAIANQFSVYFNVFIPSNAPRYFIVQSNLGRGGYTICGVACLRDTACRAFSSDNYNCRLYNTNGVPTTNSSGWMSGFRR